MAGRTGHSTFKFTSFLMIGALVGKLLGFLREILFARALGANLIADSFRGAMTAVLLPISPLQGDMVPSTLVPMHKEWASQNRAPAMFSSLAVVFGLIAVVFASLVAIFAPYYVNFLVGGFSEEAKATTVYFTRIMALAMPGSVLLNLFSCIELSLGLSRLTAIRASVQNVAVIAGILVLYWTHNPIGIAWGFSIAYCITSLYGFFMLCKEGELSPSSIRLSLCVSSFKEFLVRVKPLFIQPLFDQTNLIVEKLLASVLVVGSIASLDYARTLTDTMNYLVSQPIGFVVLRKDTSDIKNLVITICRPVIGLSIPATVFMIVFASDIVTIVFQRGEFQQHAIDVTTQAVQGISFGLWATLLGWILVRMLNAQHRNGTAAKIFACAYIGNMIVNFATYKYYGVFGIGLGEGIRGIIMLAGTAYALGCSKILFKLVMTAMPLAALLSIASLTIRQFYDTPFLRLSIAVPVFSLTVFPWLFFMVPEIKNIIVTKYARLMFWRSNKDKL